jgi:hypothetical protein
MQGQWFKWFSPDDVMESFAIETLVCKAKSFGTDVILYSNWKIIDENNKTLRSFYESNYNDLSVFDFNVRLLDGQQINVNTTLIPSHLFSNGCKIKELSDPVAIDYDLFLQAGILFGVTFFLIEDFLVKYRIHEKQQSHTHIAKTLNYLQSVRDSILSELDTDTKNQYLDSLSKYKKTKPVIKKILDLGLQIMLQIMPTKLADQILVFYVNKIRHGR